MRAAVILALILSVVPSVQPSQVRLADIAETYRRGNTAEAIEMLRAENTDKQIRAAKDLVKVHGVIRVPSEDAMPSAATRATWTIALLRALGAVYMESALDLYTQRGRNLASVMISQLEGGEIILDEVGRLEEKPSDASQWELAIGLRAMAEGQFETARTVLLRSCQRYPGQPQLLVACGTVYETFAAIRPDLSVVLSGVERDRGPNDISQRALTMIRAAHRENLERAHTAFQQAVKLDPLNAEAGLRLGKVTLDQGDTAEASKLLESFVRLKTDQRATYLSRLFLGRVREREKRFDEALTLFQEAIAIMPAQSARLALANRFHASGRNADALTLADAVTTDRIQEDPWWTYRLGQYWLPDPLLESLRLQARAGAKTGAPEGGR